MKICGCGCTGGIDSVYLVNDDQERFRVQRNDKNCMCVQLILYSLDAPLVSAQRVFRLAHQTFHCSNAPLHTLATID